MDDEKFTDTIIDQFEAVAPNKSVYFVEVKDNNCKLKYVKSQNKNIIFDTIDSERFDKIKSNLPNYNVVVLHNLIRSYRQQVVKGASKDVRFHWMVWGSDYYNLINSEKYLLSYSSKKYIRKHKNINWYIGKYITNQLPLFNFLLKKEAKSYNKKDYSKLFDKIASFSTVIPNEAEMINKILKKRQSYIPLKYGFLENLILTDESLVCNDYNFFVGNSATPSNNHIEAIEEIMKYKKSQNLYIPISYGNIKYGKFLKDHFSEMKSDIYFMEDFIDIKSYNEILLKCGNVVMNHYRQQAMGNIIIALYNGARVFLNKKSPVFLYLRRLGIKFFDVEQDLQRLDLLPTFTELANHNRPILRTIYSNEKVLDETKNFVDYFFDNNKF